MSLIVNGRKIRILGPWATRINGIAYSDWARILQTAVNDRLQELHPDWTIGKGMWLTVDHMAVGSEFFYAWMQSEDPKKAAAECVAAIEAEYKRRVGELADAYGEAFRAATHGNGCSLGDRCMFCRHGA